MKQKTNIPWPRLARLLLFCLLAAGLAACGGDNETDGETPVAVVPTSTTAPGASATADTGGEALGRAYIEGLAVTVLEAAPTRVEAIVRGNLSDGCTAINTITAPRSEQTFQIQIETMRDADLVCTEALVPFEQMVELDVSGLPAGTYAVTAGDLQESFTLTADNAPVPTPDLGSASLTVGAQRARPGELVTLIGMGFPGGATVSIGIGPPESEYEIIGSTQAAADGRFSTQTAVPAYVQPGEQWVFVAVVDNATIVAEPISIVAGDTATGTPPSAPTGTPVSAPTRVPDVGVNEPVNGQFTRTYVHLIAIGDAGQSGQQIGCDDSVVPVVVEINPTPAPLTAALQKMFSFDEQYYGQSGLYNVFYQSNLSVQGINIIAGEAIINLTGDLQLGGVCDNPRVQAQIAQTALQYSTIDSVTINLNGEPLTSVLSGQ